MKNGARKNATSFERSKFANYYSFSRDKGYALVVVVARRQFSHAREKPFRDRIDGKKRTILFLILPFLPFFFFFLERTKRGRNMESTIRAAKQNWLKLFLIICLRKRMSRAILSAEFLSQPGEKTIAAVS